jgi:hypothetical protein
LLSARFFSLPESTLVAGVVLGADPTHSTPIADVGFECRVEQFVDLLVTMAVL